MGFRQLLNVWATIWELLFNLCSMYEGDDDDDVFSVKTNNCLPIRKKLQLLQQWLSVLMEGVSDLSDQHLGACIFVSNKA